MKKVYLLCLSLFAALGMNAEVAQKWDFTNGWSQATLDNLAANVAAGGDWTVESEGKSYQSGKRTAGPLTIATNAGDYTIPETAGLSFNQVSAKHIVIVYNDESGKYPTSYLWLNGKKAEDQIVIHNVEPGQLITIDYQGHNGEDRGMKAITAGVYVKGTSTVSATSRERTKVIFETDQLEAAGDVVFQATNGFHIYGITVGTDEPGIDIGYIYNSSYAGYDANNDLMSAIVFNLNQNNNVTSYDLASGTPTTEQLTAHQVVVVGSSVSGQEADAAQAIKDAIAFVPMLNMSTNFYSTWGYGQTVNTTEKSVIVGAAARNYALFRSKQFEGSTIQEDGSLALLTEDALGLQGYTADEGTYFANDSVLAKTEAGINIFHMHNMTRNAYLLLPYSYENLLAADENAFDILNNALSILADTKNDIIKTATPTINSTNKNLLTTVALKCGTSGSKIYYTLDGTDPTLESIPYTASFDITEQGTVVKAIALADGYLLSEIACDTIDVLSTATPPHFEVVKQSEGLTRVKITCDYDGADIYYNYSGSSKEDASALYTNSIDLTEPTKIYAFTSHPDLVNSEVVSQFFTVDGTQIRVDTIALMNSNSKEYGSGDLVKAYNYWTSEKADSTSEVLVDFEGNVVKCNDGVTDSLVWTYTYVPTDSLTYKDFGNGWAIGSYGQRINNQGTGADAVIGADYGPLTAYDAGATGGSMSFLVTKTVNDPCSAWLQTTLPLQAPFNITAWVCSQSSVANVLEVSVSPDGETWEVIDTLQCQEGKHMKKLTTSYEGNDMVYFKLRSANTVSTNAVKTCIFDVLLQNNGPISQSMDPSGIQEAIAPAGEIVKREIFSMDGMQMGQMKQGVNIVRFHYANGGVKTMKVMMK